MNNFIGQKVLVVGGEGFIGQHLIKKLCELQASVVSLGVMARIDSKAYDYLSVDIRDKNMLASSLENYDFEYVFNLGGYIDHSCYSERGRNVLDVHFVGLMNLLDQVCGPRLKCFVHVGSSDEYGNAPSPQNETMREAPISPYSAAKVAATHLFQALARSEKFPGVIVRPFLSYGPGQGLTRLIPQVINGCLKNISFPVSEGGQLRDFCYVEDIIEGMLLAGTSKSALGEVFNLASGEPVSVRDVIETVMDITGNGKPEWGAVKYRPSENMMLYADIAKAKKILKWQPKISLREGLLKTIDFYQVIQGD